MILVITGTERFPFPRLIDAVDALAGSGAAGDDFFVQLGATRDEPRHCRFERFLPFARVLEEVQRARVVVTHAGAGTALLCIQQGKHPVLVPRLPQHGEVIDGHQVPFAEELARAGLATVVLEMAGLGAAIAEAAGRAAPAGAVGRAGTLTTWLDGFWRGLPGAAPAPRGR